MCAFTDILTSSDSMRIQNEVKNNSDRYAMHITSHVVVNKKFGLFSPTNEWKPQKDVRITLFLLLRFNFRFDGDGNL